MAPLTVFNVELRNDPNPIRLSTLEAALGEVYCRRPGRSCRLVVTVERPHSPVERFILLDWTEWEISKDNLRRLIEAQEGP